MVRYSKDQIKKAKELAYVLYGEKMNNPEGGYTTTWGTKTNTGIINTILAVMFGDQQEKEQAGANRGNSIWERGGR